MDRDSYYKDHWIEIEEDRLDRYEQMFQWSPAFETLLAPADIQENQIVGDLGCGPGFLSCQLLQKVAPSGRVHAFDVNEDFDAGDIVSKVTNERKIDFVVLPDFLFENDRNINRSKDFIKIEVEQEMILSISNTWKKVLPLYPISPIN